MILCVLLEIQLPITVCTTQKEGLVAWHEILYKEFLAENKDNNRRPNP
jgi:hypothetical protein